MPCLAFDQRDNVVEGASIMITNFCVVDGIIRLYETTEVGRLVIS